MNTVSKVIITTVIVVVVIAGGWWLIASRSTTNNESSNNTDSSQTGSEDTGEVQEAAATITYNGSEFTPNTITVKAGDTIEVVNNSSNVIYFASNEHPIHQDNTELNVGDIQPGSKVTFSITAPGTWEYHDHYNASAGGEITVE